MDTYVALSMSAIVTTVIYSILVLGIIGFIIIIFHKSKQKKR